MVGDVIGWLPAGRRAGFPEDHGAARFRHHGARPVAGLALGAADLGGRSAGPGGGGAFILRPFVHHGDARQLFHVYYGTAWHRLSAGNDAGLGFPWRFALANHSPIYLCRGAALHLHGVFHPPFQHQSRPLRYGLQMDRQDARRTRRRHDRRLRRLRGCRGRPLYGACQHGTDCPAGDEAVRL